MTEHTPEYGPRHVWGSYVSTNSVNERPIGRYTDTEFAPRQSFRATAPLPATGTGAIGLATA
ncbi:hypothetical protein [Herbiconiux sp. VKM Ac-2851]|uniref:hypothetical protein n=1 Tax=Herbiconiux sp. VKM Ac-2851 TaxID=2739025 RepID=UPI0015652546|nr:hypothetical protein [Herbiconiux sp. VKM Ac-2851]NQX35242.1 hypothetical protein [Herbiconiux sp. VKM Ac-2851]